MSTSNPLPAALFTAVDHVGVAVADYDAAIAFYRDVFGLRVAHEEVNQEQGVREAMLAVGDGDTRVQVLAPLTPESAIARFLERSGPGLQQVAYRVEDVDAVSGDSARAGPAAALRPAATRDGGEQDQLRAPQGRRRRPRRAGGAGRLLTSQGQVVRHPARCRSARLCAVGDRGRIGGRSGVCGVRRNRNAPLVGVVCLAREDAADPLDPRAR